MDQLTEVQVLAVLAARRATLEEIQVALQQAAMLMQLHLSAAKELAATLMRHHLTAVQVLQVLQAVQVAQVLQAVTLRVLQGVMPQALQEPVRQAQLRRQPKALEA